MQCREGHVDYTDEDVILRSGWADNTGNNEPLGFIFTCVVKVALCNVEGHFDYTDEDVILDVDENDNTEHNEPLGFIKIGLKQEKKCVLSWNSDTNPKRLKNKRQVYGPGIYSSPDPDFASDGWYAEHFNFKGRRFQVLVENLVNMTNTVVREHKKVYQTMTEKKILRYS